jgi:putative PIN family toxin of toxin-antitoxin system
VLRAVVDVNVLVLAALSPSGSVAQLLRLADRPACRLVVSPEPVAELDEVLHRPKFATRVSRRWADALVLDLRRTAEVRYPPAVVQPITRDADDDYLVELTRYARCDALVTGDRDLLDAGLDDVRVLSPRDFLTLLAHREA